MTAPDPGLTDLIAAHQFDPVGRICSCGVMCGVVCDNLTYPAHVALVVEQHTNGRITELEAEVAEAKDDKFYARVELNADMQWKARAEKAEATIARVEKLQRDLFQQGGNLIAQWGAARLIRAALQEEFIRAALEGEQQ